MQGNTLRNNSAKETGGAIYYDLYSPSGLTDNLYYNNIAKYGDNFGSYAFNLKPVIKEPISGTFLPVTAKSDTHIQLVSG